MIMVDIDPYIGVNCATFMGEIKLKIEDEVRIVVGKICRTAGSHATKLWVVGRSYQHDTPTPLDLQWYHIHENIRVSKLTSKSTTSRF